MLHNLVLFEKNNLSLLLSSKFLKIFGQYEKLGLIFFFIIQMSNLNFISNEIEKKFCTYIWYNIKWTHIVWTQNKLCVVALYIGIVQGLTIATFKICVFLLISENIGENYIIIGITGNVV